VSGNIKASGTVSQGSSKEFKKNIASVSTKDAMNALNKLNPVRFEYKTDNSGEKHLGFIAEDVPDLVAEYDRKHINSMDITAVLTKVVQEQQRQIEQLRNEIAELKRTIKTNKT
ncbi:MAG: tail fiber domain-containing protein, partial [Planctomycetota bacterium]